MKDTNNKIIPNSYEEEINNILDNLDSKILKTSSILSRLDLSDFTPDTCAPNIKFTYNFFNKLFLFRLIKGLKNYEKIKIYLESNEKEAFELGFQKNEENKLIIPAKRTYNNYLKTQLTIEQKEKLILIAERILYLSSEKSIMLDLEVVKETIKEKKENYDLEEKEMIKLVKRLVYPQIDLKIHKNARFTTADFLDILVSISREHGYANDGAECFKEDKRDKESPSGDLMMYHFSKLKSKSEIKMLFVKILDLIFKYLRKNYNLFNHRRFDIAYDIHKIDYYGKTIEYVCGDKPENGVYDFFKFLTCSIVVSGQRFILDVVPIHPLNSIPNLLDESLRRVRNKIKIDKVLLDRGFNSIEFINVLNSNRVKFIMPVQRWPTVKSYFFKDQQDICDALVFDDFIIGKKKRQLKVNLFLIKSNPNKKRPRKDDETRVGEKHAFISNFYLPTCLAAHIYDWYGKRWGIETGYRQIDHDFLARTTSPRYNIRLFYFLFSCVLFNLWVFVNIKLSLLIYGKVSKKPIITAKRFSKILSLINPKYFDNGG